MVSELITNYEDKLAEQESEIRRHHYDFERIQKICAAAFHPATGPKNALFFQKALKEIRNIVG